jgi:anti-sigma factor RsiW
MPGCNDVRDNLAAFQDGQLEAETQAQVKAHLDSCVACQQEAIQQGVVKNHLQKLKERSSDAAPPAHIWTNAQHAWNEQDARSRRRLQMRFAMVGACLLLATFGIVWAWLAQPMDFPTAVVMRDFRALLQNPSPAPAFPSRDADQAAVYLRERLHIDLPPVRLTLSDAELLGADVLADTKPPIGRLLYQTKNGIAAVYVSPRSSRFVMIPSRKIAGRTFFVEDKPKDVGLYGWSSGLTGYGLVLPQPIEQSESLASDAQRATGSTSR